METSTPSTFLCFLVAVGSARLARPVSDSQSSPFLASILLASRPALAGCHFPLSRSMLMATRSLSLNLWILIRLLRRPVPPRPAILSLQPLLSPPAALPICPSAPRTRPALLRPQALLTFLHPPAALPSRPALLSRQALPRQPARPPLPPLLRPPALWSRPAARSSRQLPLLSRLALLS
ncbi:hypothetical protein BKA81DRAFT_361780 [Phyllosticta paracitricarpa]